MPKDSQYLIDPDGIPLEEVTNATETAAFLCPVGHPAPEQNRIGRDDSFRGPKRGAG